MSLFLILATGAVAQKYDNLARTPQMGWNSWNKFASGVNEQVIRETIDTMVELGLVDAGYVYINVDDFWHGERDENGFITCDSVRFPSGIKALADYAHSKGMKFGLYSDAGSKTCGGCAGSQGHEYQDAIQYARWGVDYLKYDWCFTETTNPQKAYKLMRDALAQAGRPIFFSMCEWGTSKPWEWAAEVGHSWRTTGDISANFAKDIVHHDPGNTWTQLCVLSILDMNAPLREYAGPGHWNDPDMLECGNGMSVSEDRAHFTMWCMMAAPLLLGNDLTAMTPEVKEIISNRDMIAVDQDPLGVQGLRYRRDGDLEYWFKPLEGGDWAFAVLNRAEEAKWITVDWDQFTFTDDFSGCSTAFDETVYTCRDLWDKSNVSTTADVLKTAVQGHDVVAYRLTPKYKRLVAKVDMSEDLLFFQPQKAKLKVDVKNPADKALAGKVQLKLYTDKHEYIKTYTKTAKVAARNTKSVYFEFPLTPGFYRCEVSAADGTVHRFNIGYEPEKVISEPDGQPDLREFWDKALAELAQVDPEYEVKLLPEHCTSDGLFYEITMKSLGGVTIKAYYSEPLKDGKYPVIVNYMGYGAGPYFWKPDTRYAELLLSIRGQGINIDDNDKGQWENHKWIEYRLDDPEQYYYRGAWMDLVRGIDFVCTRDKVDDRYIFAQGSSQGGASTFAACALDHRITAACPDVPFLSDYKDYFKIVDWPASDVYEGQKAYGISDDELYRNLSYFDIKNIASWIECPIWMAYGLQDETCPPHTNFAAYNNVRSDKKYLTFKLRGHNVWEEMGWQKDKIDYFLSFVKKDTDHVVAAYVTSWTDEIPDPSVLTHLNYAFGGVNDSFNGIVIDNEPRLRQMVALKKISPELKVLVSVGGWGAGNFSEMASTAERRSAFAKDCARVIDEFGLDGIDIDWEYPTRSDAGISSSPEDTHNFTLLVREIRSVIGPDKLLTIATPCTGQHFDFPEIIDCLDFVNVMAYDMQNGPDNFHCALYRSPNAGAVTAEEAVVNHIKAGVPARKLVMGMSFYGRGIPELRKYGNYRDLPSIIGDKYHKMWDAEACGPYLVDDEGHFVFGYDDTRSLELKCRYILDRGLLGGMYWDYHGDNEAGDLSHTVSRELLGR